MTLTAAKKDEDAEPVDAWASAKQDRGAKRRASNSGDMEVSAGSSAALASGPGVVAPEVPSDRDGTVAQSDESGKGMEVARRWIAPSLIVVRRSFSSPPTR